MMENLAQAGEDERWHAHCPPPFTISTITYKFVVYAPAECCVGDTAQNVKRCQPLSPNVLKIFKRYQQQRFNYFLGAVADSA
jgi:hypothetical protein